MLYSDDRNIRVEDFRTTYGRFWTQLSSMGVIYGFMVNLTCVCVNVVT
jgi:hypothetical protein